MGHNTGVTHLHNIMVGRVVILLIIAMAKKIWWCLEQPKGSLLEGHVLFQRMLYLRHVAVSRATCSLGHFGADSLKPVWIYSSNFGNQFGVANNFVAYVQNMIILELLVFPFFPLFIAPTITNGSQVSQELCSSMTTLVGHFDHPIPTW